MPEKTTPHFDLAKIKTAFLNGSGATTRTATVDAAALGFGSDEISAVIQTITRKHFYKSMTSIYSNAIWQDVYRVPHADGELYVKFTDNGGPDFVLLSFKER